MNGSRDFNAGLISDEPFTIGKKSQLIHENKLKNPKEEREFQGLVKSFNEK